MEQLFETTIKVPAKDEHEMREKAKAIQVLTKNLDRDSLVILANKSQKAGINQKIIQYQNII